MRRWEFTLSNGIKVPAGAFGTYKAADWKSAEIMSMAIENAKAAFQRSLERLKTDYLDMYLIH